MTPTLTEAFDAYADGRGLADPVAAKRAFMSGAMAALEALRSGATREALTAEIVGFGRTVGTAAERATVNQPARSA